MTHTTRHCSGIPHQDLSRRYPFDFVAAIREELHMNAMAPSDQLPAGNPERTVAALWREVLEIQDSPAMSDNFFAMGGDSMAMVTLEFRIQEETGVSLPPGAVLAAPTLEELVALVRRELASKASE